MIGSGGSLPAKLVGTQSAPDICRRLTGAALRWYRESLGLSLEDASAILECDRSKLSRIETGQRGIRPKELRKLLKEYTVGKEEQDVLLLIASTKGPWRPYASTLPEAVISQMVLESCATDIVSYEAQCVPRILQTPEYALALAEADPSYGDDAAIASAEATATWQSTLAKADLPVRVILGQPALLQRTGGKRVMHEQLERIADPPDGVLVQILPFPMDTNPAPWAGSLTRLTFGIAGLPCIACIGGPAGPIFLDDPANAAACTRIITRLQGLALTRSTQKQLLDGLLAS
jgi:transcriptional regulator with XRE-family HTH domain